MFATGDLCPIKPGIRKKISNLIKRITKSRNHIVMSSFWQKSIISYLKLVWILIHFKKRVDFELQTLNFEGHIDWKKWCRWIFHFDNGSHSKNNQSIKLALASKVLNKSTHKEKYKMPNIEVLMVNTQNNCYGFHRSIHNVCYRTSWNETESFNV